MSKGQEMPMNTIVVIALALIVLVVVGVFFFMGMSRQSGLLTQQVGAATGGEEGMKKTECQSVCTSVSFTSISGSCTVSNLQSYPEIMSYVNKNCPCYSSCSVSMQGGGTCNLNKVWGCCNSVSTALNTLTNCGSCGTTCSGTRADGTAKDCVTGTCQ